MCCGVSENFLVVECCLKLGPIWLLLIEKVVPGQHITDVLLREGFCAISVNHSCR